MPLIDVHSKIEALPLQPKFGLGMPLFVMKKTGSPDPTTTYYAEYRTVKEFQNDVSAASIKDDAVLLGKLAAVFAQKSRHNKFAILLCEEVPTALKSVLDKDFFFILNGGVDEATNTAIANYCDSVDNKMLRIGIIQSAETTAGAPFKALQRVVSLQHPVVNEYFDAALVAEVGSQEVGSVTWKFKSLIGITEQYLTEEEMLAIDDNRMIAYAYKHGKAQTTEGWTSYLPEDQIPRFIDDLHGEAWVRYDVEKRIAKMLQDTPKLPYDARGISVLLGCATTSLQTAAAMGIIGQDDDGVFVYTARAKTRDEQEQEDLATRTYKGIEYTYRKSDAIHEVYAYGSVSF